MRDKRALNFLNNEYPVKVRTHFTPIIKRAYDAVEKLCEEREMLNNELNLNVKGYLRNIAVEYEFKRLIDSGKLNLDYDIVLNSRKNHKHIEIKSKNSIMTISQLSSPKAVPRRSDFRVNLSQSNQIMMDFLQDDIKLIESPAFILLTHGVKNNKMIKANSEVSFVQLGLPAPYVGKWIESIDLINEPEEIINYETQDEDAEELVKLKDFLKKEVL